MKRRRENPWTKEVLLLGLILLAFVIRTYHLDFQSLWRDEVDAVIFAQRDLSALLGNFGKVGENGPLYFLLLHFWVSLVGTREFAIRFLSVAAGVLAIPLAYRFGKQVWDARAGLLVALLITISPYHAWYSQEAKMYSSLAFLALLSLHLFLSAQARNRLSLWIGHMVVTALLPYIHLFALLIILVEGVWFLSLRQRYATAARKALLSLSCIIFPCLPLATWLVPTVLTPATTGYPRYGLMEMSIVLLRSFSLGMWPISSPLPLALFTSLFLAGLLYRGRGEVGEHERSVLRHQMAARRGIAFLLLLCFALPIVVVYLVSLSRPIFAERYLIIVLPVYYLLVAGGLMVISQKSRVVFAICLSLIALFSLHAIWTQGHTKIKADFRAAARFFAMHAEPDEPVVFLMPYIRHAFAYYHPGRINRVEVPCLGQNINEESVAGAMREAISGHPRAWLILSEAEFCDSSGLIKAWFEANGQRVFENWFSYIEVRGYDLDQAAMIPNPGG